MFKRRNIFALHSFFFLVAQIVLALIAFSLPLSTQAQAQIQETQKQETQKPEPQKPSLTLNSASADPLSNAYNSGFIDKLLRIAFERLGYDLKRVQLPAERALRDVNQGKLDGEFIRIDGIQNKYRNLIKVDEKIIDLDFVVFSEIAINTESGWNALEPFNVAFLSGWKIVESNMPKKARIIKVNRPQQLFYMLYKKRADAIVYERWAGLNILTNDPRYHPIKVRMPPLATKPMFCYLNKKHADLVPKLADMLKELKQDGTYKTLYNTTLYHLAE